MSQASGITLKGPGRTSTSQFRPDPATFSAGLRIGLAGTAALAESAVAEWFRIRSFPFGRLAGEFGLEFCLTDLSAILHRSLRADDLIVTRTEPVGSRYFTVRLFAGADDETPIASARVTVVMVRTPGVDAVLPEELDPLAVRTIDALGTAVTTHDPQFEARDLESNGVPPGSWQLRRQVLAGDVGYRGRMRHVAHARFLEEALDRYLTDHGSPSATRVLNGRYLEVPRFRVRMLNDAIVGDTLVATIRLHQVLQDSLMDLRFDAHAVRGDRRIPVSTAILVAGLGSADPDGFRLEPLDPCLRPEIAQSTAESS
ncbi:hypothetical protein AB0H36_34080 [Kribbella sp. NPDC050820]|uniref:hypothetical protein n=1 Tax=Kribbella sp. NPDC050820 TaxID=3155408 RepID=UPI0033E64CF2